ncbi:MAG: hypothetical protein COV67_02585 [Nitrospinae bacterium CG11_big_fil_rev_8_21_14_0_20_56_8]|nr:MAG: hypothetical protein COV67_02585 [Nitrospinae bacterium CG11_big_fil_rev_8_21_14_0_20_56_8]
MTVTEVSAENPIVDQRRFSQGESVRVAADVNLKTQEGDVVHLSSQGGATSSDSVIQPPKDENVAVQEFSSVSVAASNYSLAVQGDLTDGELSAIQKLSQQVAPVVESFFDDAQLDPGQTRIDTNDAVSVVNGLADVVHAALGRTVSNSSQVTGQTATPAPAATGPDGQPVDFSQVRDVAKMVQSVVNAEFENQTADFPKDAPILKTLNDLMDFIRNQLGKVLAPLNHLNDDFPAPPETASRQEPVAA